MRIVFVGCGFIAQHYLTSLPRHPHVKLVGVMDIDQRRAGLLAKAAGVRTYESLDSVLADEAVDAIVNLTTPDHHFVVSKAALLAGKHVYTEKPMTTNWSHAQELHAIAEHRGLELCTAPCSVLGEAAQTTWNALRTGAIGTPRLVLAELNEGFMTKQRYKFWQNSLGIPWPYKDEFKLGCTLEHVGYFISWFATFFGPVRRVHTFASCLLPDKGSGFQQHDATPDFTVGCLEFDDGMVARLTTSVVAPRDRSMVVIGDEGILKVDDCWRHQSRVAIRRRWVLRNRMMLTRGRRVPLIHRANPAPKNGSLRLDWAAGLGEMATAIRAGRLSRLNRDFTLHTTEVSLALGGHFGGNGIYETTTGHGPIRPMTWGPAS